MRYDITKSVRKEDEQMWFGEITMGPVSHFYEEGQYDETPYCANCNLEVGPGGRVDAKFPEQDDYNRCAHCVNK